MLLLGFANSLPLLFVARIWSGIATANIAVAQAYIADVTTPETRARGMGLIGIGFGLGFIFGPAIGGDARALPGDGARGGAGGVRRRGAVGVELRCWRSSRCPSRCPASGGARCTAARRLLDCAGRLREVARRPGMAVALVISFFVVFWFSGLEVTFRLFTEDAFGMSMQGTGMLFAFVGVIAVLVQGGLIHPLTRRFGEVRLIRTGLFLLAVGFFLDGISPSIGPWFLYCASMLIAGGNGLYNPSFSSYSPARPAPRPRASPWASCSRWGRWPGCWAR